MQSLGLPDEEAAQVVDGGELVTTGLPLASHHRCLVDVPVDLFDVLSLSVIDDHVAVKGAYDNIARISGQAEPISGGRALVQVVVETLGLFESAHVKQSD